MVAPGADPRAIALNIVGADTIEIDAQGNLHLHTAGGDVVEHAPVLYQIVGGTRQSVWGSYVLEGDHQVGFQVGAYDASRPLCIDPVLVYSTYLGGSGSSANPIGDQGDAIAVDSSGAAYVTGYTTTTDFPEAGTAPASAAGNEHVFVTKLDPTGTRLVYSTYIGGTGEEDGNGIAVDAQGDAFVTGETDSTDFPGANLSNPSRPVPAGAGVAFVTKLDPSGKPSYSIVLTGQDGDLGDIRGNAIAVDADGNAFVAGNVDQPDIPIVNAYQDAFGTAGFTGFTNPSAFVAEVNSGGTALVYCTYLRSNSNVEGGFATSANAIAVDPSDHAFVTGKTRAVDFPTTVGALHDKLLCLGGDAFVCELSAITPLSEGNVSLEYSTYLGGNDVTSANAIALDSGGDAYIAGYTYATNLGTAGAAQTNLFGDGSHEDGFVARVDPSGAMLYSTYLGGSDDAAINGIAADAQGNAYVVGTAVVGTGHADDFPTVNPFQPNSNNMNGVLQDTTDAFVTKIDPTGSALVYSSYYGDGQVTTRTFTGSLDVTGDGIAVDSTGSAYIVGRGKLKIPNLFFSYTPGVSQQFNGWGG